MRERLRFLRTRSGTAGAVLVALVLLVALFGPLVSPHSPIDTIGPPGSGPTSGAPLGTDFLGRDVLSRVLWGGWSVLALGTAATLIAYAVGGTIGLVAGSTRRVADGFLMRGMDLLLVFPPLLFLLVLAAGLGTGETVLIIGIAIIQIPGIARLVRAATVEASVRGYVEAAEARGETARAIMLREIAPNIVAPVVADLGLRFTFSILLVAAANFLNIGLQPPDADWSLMISENRVFISLNPFVILAPAALLAMLTVGVNLVGDAVARTIGHSDVASNR
jgi:peptide/nickel transport system permease protein